MGDFNAQIGKRPNSMETATDKFGLEYRNERGDTLSNLKKVQNHEYHVPEESRRKWTLKSPNGVTMAEIDYILTNKPGKQRIEYKTIKKQGGHQEIQPRDHTRNDHGIKEPEESPKNAEARTRQTDHTPGQAGKRNP